jgi:hypothetical protein
VRMWASPAAVVLTHHATDFRVLNVDLSFGRCGARVHSLDVAW